MTRSIARQKSITLLVTLGALSAFTPLQTMLLFVVFGHAHFLAAYYYQWRAGKWGLRGAAAFIVSATSIIGITTYTGALETLVLVSSIIFFVHHFQDEVLLWGKERSLYRTIEQSAPVLLYSALAADLLIDTSVAATALWGAALFWILRIALTFLWERTPLDILSLYFGIWTVGLASSSLFLSSVAPEKFIGAIILFHYISWLVYYYEKLAPSREKQYAYSVDMLAIHGIVFGLFALMVYLPFGYATLGPLFSPIVFYTFAILHILFSVRVTDYKSAFVW